MDKQAVSHSLEQLAAFLELKGESRFRVRAFENAARAIASFPGELRDAAAAGALRAVAGAVRWLGEVTQELELGAVHAGDAAAEALLKRLGQAPGVTELAGREGTVTLRFASGTVVAVALATPDEFGIAWIRATGAPAH